MLELLTEDHVLVHPGFFFDFEREAFLVVSLLVEPEVFDRGIATASWRAHRTSEQRCDERAAEAVSSFRCSPSTSTRSWGMGEFTDLPVFARWAQSAGQAFVQILPITEIPEAETSPYSALTAMALDPIYISLPALEDFRGAGRRVARCSDDDKCAARRTPRRSSQVDHQTVRTLKIAWLRRAYEQFLRRRAGPRNAARAAFRRVRGAQKAGGSTTTPCSRRSAGSSS